MQFQVRPSTQADMAAVDALLARVYPKLLKADYPPSVLVTALPRISRAQPELMGCGTYYVAETRDGRILGAGGWTSDRKVRGLGHIRHVVSDDRFLRRGVARAIIGHALDTARLAGMSAMECWSTRTAEPFYHAMGFETIGPIDVPLGDGISFPSLRMHRRLPGASTMP
ncbi:GNAT family N-acetyltransferase [Thalassococcus sp. S3]|uniref:GNAT family N-acetyltransferase n=1 Tax=Thalassococcus sp. S3 TaxID=2017482 RepID=UPI00102436E4|nr:GNAT family N-acetyltransferase [Thalassococcus sp. S3]QBF32908.1 GNAT family N-acetyltransferase [Thalassococcus sp. S3]